MANNSPLFMSEWYCRTSNRHFLYAVLVTFEDAREKGLEPSCTYWAANHAYLARLLPQIRDAWSGQTDLHPALFPWTVDEVATTWEEWRKCNLQYRAAFLRQLNLHGLADGYEQEHREKLRKKQEAGQS